MQVVLQVGERRFVTTSDTLIQGSGFLRSLFSGRWDNAQDDGSHFVDADGDLFVHVLRYLRRGVFPLFYNISKVMVTFATSRFWLRRGTFSLHPWRIGSMTKHI